MTCFGVVECGIILDNCKHQMMKPIRLNMGDNNSIHIDNKNGIKLSQIAVDIHDKYKNLYANAEIEKAEIIQFRLESAIILQKEFDCRSRKFKQQLNCLEILKNDNYTQYGEISS